MIDMGKYLIGAAVAVTVAGSAMAVTSADFTYNREQIGYFTIAPTEFSPIDSTAAANFRSNGTFFANNGSGVAVCATVGLHLPELSRIEGVTMIYSDGSLSAIDVDVYRTRIADSSFAFIFSRRLDNNLSVRTTTNLAVEPSVSLIKNASFAYTARICLGENSFVHAMRIKYSYTNAGS